MKTKTVTSTEAQNQFGGVLEALIDGPVEVTRNGRSVCVIVSVRDWESLLASMEGGND